MYKRYVSVNQEIKRYFIKFEAINKKEFLCYEVEKNIYLSCLDKLFSFSGEMLYSNNVVCFRTSSVNFDKLKLVLHI